MSLLHDCLASVQIVDPGQGEAQGNVNIAEIIIVMHSIRVHAFASSNMSCFEPMYYAYKCLFKLVSMGPKTSPNHNYVYKL